MMEYFYDTSDGINREIQGWQGRVKNNSSDAWRGRFSDDLINKEILMNSTEILRLLLRLNMFEVLQDDQAGENGKLEDRGPMYYYCFLLKYLFRIFMYDRRHIKYTCYFIESEDNRIKDELTKKEQENQKLNLNLNINLGFATGAKKDEAGEKGKDK